MDGIENYKRTLSLEIYDKSWAGDFWGVNGALTKAKELYWMIAGKGKKRDALSSLSSTYFSAAGNAKAIFFKARFYAKPLWVFRVVWCLFQANRLSDKLKRVAGIEKMKISELDVRIAIMLAVFRMKSARKCLDEFISREEKPSDTIALIISHFLNHRFVSKEFANKSMGDLRSLLLEPLRSTTRVRVLREMGLYQKRRGDWDGAREFFSEALKIAETEDLGDQILKIKFAMK